MKLDPVSQNRGQWWEGKICKLEARIKYLEGQVGKMLPPYNGNPYPESAIVDHPSDEFHGKPSKEECNHPPLRTRYALDGCYCKDCGKHLTLVDIWEDTDNVTEPSNADLDMRDHVQSKPVENTSTEQWQPKDGETYYFVDSVGQIRDWYNDTEEDKAQIEFGNCFKTREEAEAARDRVKKALKGESYNIGCTTESKGELSDQVG